MDEITELIEEKLAEIFDGIENGDEKAFENLKKLKNFLTDICEFLSFVNDEDTIETIRKKFEEMSEKYEKILLENFRAVG